MSQVNTKFLKDKAVTPPKVGSLAATSTQALFADGSGGASFRNITSSDISGYLAKISGDIDPSSFSAANNQSTPANVTGLAFANGTTRAFTAFVSITVIATSSLYEYVTLSGIQRGADWQMTATSAGDISGFLFTITTSGAIQYTDLNYSGFSSATLKFRAITLPI